MVPNDIQGELKHLYIAAGELLRHFWSCFPVNTPFLEEKVTDIDLFKFHMLVISVWFEIFCTLYLYIYTIQVTKMKTNLERFQLTKLRPFQEKIQRQYLSTNVSHTDIFFVTRAFLLSN